MQAVGLHQNVGNTGGLKQHTAIGNNNEYLLHVLKSNLLHNKSILHTQLEKPYPWRSDITATGRWFDVDSTALPEHLP